MQEKKNSHPPSILSFAEHFAGLNAFTESIFGPIEEMNKAFLQQQESISAMFQELDREFAQAYPQLEVAADRLADMGWTIPMQLTPRTLVSLADSAYSESDIEAMLLDFYTDVDLHWLRVAQKDMLNSPVLTLWRGLLNEAFEAFFQGRYQIPVPALLAVTEGVIASESGTLKTGIVKVRRLAADQEAKARPQTWEALIWRSTRRWIDNLFADSRFSGPQPPRMNRHWILHGRHAGPWTRTDVVRLLVALHTLAS